MVRYLLPLLLLLGGCSATPEKTVEMVDWAPPPLPEAEPQQVVNGSLYNSMYSNNLFADRMAYRVGDILTVDLDERTRSSTSAGTSTSKSSGMDMSAPVIWGETGRSSNLGMDRNFKGDGSSSQENMLSGSITVSVIEVLPNGALVVRGEKGIRLNQGDEYIRISGILRPEDITSNNTVSSQRLANARISYFGEGPLADANEQGWMTRFFNSPKFPM